MSPHRKTKCIHQSFCASETTLNEEQKTERWVKDGLTLIKTSRKNFQLLTYDQLVWGISIMCHPTINIP